MSLFQINIKTLQNLEPVLEFELRALGAADIVSADVLFHVQ